MDTICEDKRFIKQPPDGVVEKYNENIRDCIAYVLGEDSEVVWQKCTKCNNYYPYHINFFGENQHAGKEYPLNTVCKSCAQWDHNRSKVYIKGIDSELNNIYNTYGEDVYITYRDHKVLEIYEHWKSKNKNKLPKVINNIDDKLFIIKHMYNQGKFSSFDDITDTSIRNVCGFGLNGINLKELYSYIFNVGINEYKNIVNDFAGAKIIIDKYIVDNNIIIKDKYKYSYHDIIRKCSLTGFFARFYNNDLLELIMQYYDYQYPAYKFEGGFKKYWEKQENRIKALKYFIEEDMKIELEKVPLYITLTALRDKGTSTMYYVCKKYYKSLFDWVNEVYPDRFDPKDFDIHYVRNNFDSIEEAEVHDVLKKKFKYVIYNPNNTDRTIKIDGKVPDWFVFTKNKCYIVEYFGLSMDRNTSHNSRIEDYRERTENKIEKYEKLDGYGKVYIFPEDLKDNFKGLLGKLDLVV